MRPHKAKYRAAAAVLAIALFGTGCGMTESDAVKNAELQIADRDFASAVTALEEAEDKGDHSRALYRALGIAQMGSGDYESAAASFTEALKKSSGIPDDGDVDINLYLAACFVKLGKNDEALMIYDAILELDRKNTDAYRMRASVEAEAGDGDAADGDYRAAIALAPTDYESIISASETMARYGFAEKGQVYLSEAMENGSNMSAYNKGRFSYYLGDYENAKKYLEEAGADTTSKDSYRITLLLGQTYEALGSLDYAADVYQSYLSRDQSHAALYNQLGLSELRLGNAQDALTAFQAGQKLGDNSVMQSLKFNEIVAEENLGDFETARRLMEEYLKSWPEDTKAQREAVFLATR